MALQVPNLTLRLIKGTPLTAAEGDKNFTTLRDFANGVANLIAIALNNDGTLVDGAVSTAAKIADGIITAAKLAPGAITSSQYASFWEQQLSGVNGGDFTSPNVRTLSNSNNGITGASLAANVITLPAGTYRVTGWATAFKVNRHQVRVYDITNSVVIVDGSPAYSSAADDVTNTSNFAGRFILAGVTQIRLWHYCETARAADGLGRAGNLARPEIYSLITVEKEL